MARTETWLHNTGSARRAAWKYRAVDGNEYFIERVGLDPESYNAAAATSPSSGVNTPSAIASSGTTGANIDLAGTRMCGFVLGAAWTAGTLSWEVSLDGTTWVPLYNPVDNTLLSYQVAASRAYSVDPAMYAGWRWLRPKSSVAQTGGATITIAAQVV